mgnify:CR=1 FL=1
MKFAIRLIIAVLFGLFGKGAPGGPDINGPGGMGPTNFDRDT